VSGRQDQRLAGKLVPPAGPRHNGAVDLPVPGPESGELMPEADLAPERKQLAADVLYHIAQDVGADMGFVLIQDVGRRPCGDKGLQHRRDAGIADPGGELSVGKGAGAPFAELHVGGGVQDAGAPEALHILNALLDGAAALQQNRGHARAGEEKGGEQPGRAAAHHHRLGRKGASDRGKDIGDMLGQRDVRVFGAPHQRLFVRGRDLQRTDVTQLVFFAGVDGLPREGDLRQAVRRDAKKRRGPARRRLQKLPVNGERKIADTNHIYHHPQFSMKKRTGQARKGIGRAGKIARSGFLSLREAWTA